MRNNTVMPKQINAPVYRYWQALYMAFYSRRLYVDVAKRWRGFSMLYLLLLIAVVSIPLSARITLAFSDFFNEKVFSTLEQIPPLQIQDGQFLFDKPMPYVIKNKAGDIAALIDTRSMAIGMDTDYPDLVMQITKNQLFFRLPNIQLFMTATEPSVKNKPIMETLKKTDSSLFVAKEWGKKHALPLIKWVTVMMVYPMTVVFLFGMYSTMMVFVAMMAQVFAWLILRSKLTFKEALRMLIVASTAQISVFLLLMSAHALFAEVVLLCLALCFIYFSYAVLAVKRESKMLVHS